MILAGDKTEEIKGIIDDGWITAYDGNDLTSVDFGITTPEKTTLKASKMFLKVNPAHGSNLCAGETQLQWDLPEPAQAGGVVTCDIWFGTNPFIELNPKIVTGQAVESVTVTLDQETTYYWAIDLYDSGIGTDAFHYSPVLKFNTMNPPPVVNAGDDVATWVVDGERVVQLNGATSDTCGDEPTVEWTVISEPNELNPVQISDPLVLNPTVTAKEAGSYVLQLDAFDGMYSSLDTVTINVFNDSCEAAQSLPGYEPLVGDLNGDCRVDDVDLALLQENWLKDNSLTEE